MKIGLVELPNLRLLDPYGNNWVEVNDSPLISKQILMASLEAGGFEVELFDLKDGCEDEEYGRVEWKGMSLRKIIRGRRITSIDPRSCDVWGVTNNFTMYREIACLVVQHLTKGGKPIVVGGSDVIGEPQPYFEAGAMAIVTDKSGAANWPIFDHLLGKEPREPLTGVVFADGKQYRKTLHPLHPQDWHLPSLEIAKACLGNTSEFLRPDEKDALLPIGSVIPDLGCDRTCDFCQTPTYRTGYLRMTPQRVLEWCALQKAAGARSVTSESDQFLGRVLFEGGRQEVLDIVNGLREMQLPVGWPNGIEIRKATKGRGHDRNSDDLMPDEKLVEAMWGWDGKVGCYYAYIPAERPFNNRASYKKLLPWQQHCDMLRAIVRAGVPNIAYGIIVGLADDDHDNLLYLEEAIHELHQDLKTINPKLNFFSVPNAILLIPGTPQTQTLRRSGLLRFDDPAIYGNFWTASCDTRHLSYAEVSDWQMRLVKVGDEWGLLSAA
jgi:hypothetical protein